MKSKLLVALPAALLWASPALAVEIATGKMLGEGYDARSFYIREGKAPWRKTYSAPEFRPEAAGRLMNLRIAQGLFHDEWLTEVPFDPERNTDRLIEALGAYKEHGILAISVSLQAGNPAYERHGGIRRERPASLGPGKGTLTSAYRPDGSLKEAWMNRLLRLARALDRQGMVLGLMYFYQYQDEVLEDPQAIERAARNVTDWLIANDCRNVIIEIANEHDVQSYDHDRYIHRQMGRLIQVVRARFEENKAPFRLPISASTGGSMAVYDGVRDHADLVIIHGNNRTPEDKRARVAALVADPRMPGPIYMNEDNNGRETTPEHLARELASCDAVFGSGGSWGYMPWVQVQNFPFRHYRPGPGARVDSEMPVAERDPAYFHAVLEHVRKTLWRPEAGARPCSLAKAAAATRWPIPDWDTASRPEEVGMSSAGLDRYVSWLRSKAEKEPFGTVVVRHGRIAREYYGGGARAGSKWEIGSIRKSVASALLGMAIAEGKLSLDTAAHEVWPGIHSITGAEKDKRIRMRHLAANASGWMTASGPGEAWLYNNAACTAGGIVIGRVYGMPEGRIAPLVVERIAKRIGAEGWEVYHWEENFSPGSHGRTGPKLAIDSNLRDVARYGYLWLRDGEWNGVQLIPRDYVRQARRNQAADLGGHYGYWWFTNDGRALLPGAPEDAFYHVGNGRENRRTVCLVAPSLDLVAVVGAGAGAYDITRSYKAQPVTEVDEWIRRIVEAVQRP